MVKILANPSTITGKIIAPSSKSYTHRALAVGLLSKGKSTINNPLTSLDTNATIESCIALGAEIEQTESRINIKSEGTPIAPKEEIDVKNSGTTIRLMTSIAALAKEGEIVLSGDSSIIKRPIAPLLESLKDLGVDCTAMNGNPPVTIKARGIKGGMATIDGSKSSQFISSLLIACPKAEKSTIIKTKGEIVSEPYIQATKVVVEKFGTKIEQKNNAFHIKKTDYIPTTINIPSDYSSIAFLLAAGAITEGDLKIEINNENNFPQADSEIIKIMTKMNIKTELEKNRITVKNSENILGGEFNLSKCPDLLPVVSILAMKAKTSTKITGVAHARFKETDRLSVLNEELSKAGAKISEREDGLILNPPKNIKKCNFNSHKDHRMFMAFCIMGLASKESCIVEGVESVAVSYPNFIKDMKSLSADIEVE